MSGSGQCAAHALHQPPWACECPASCSKACLTVLEKRLATEPPAEQPGSTAPVLLLVLLLMLLLMLMLMLLLMLVLLLLALVLLAVLLLVLQQSLPMLGMQVRPTR